MMKRRIFPALLAVLAAGASAQIAIQGELPREFTASPGQRIEGSVTVVNPSGKTAEAKAYITDYRAQADGISYYDDPGTQPRSCAPWFSFSPKTLAIPPGQQAMITFVIDVPNDPDLFGTYWCMLMVEEALPPTRDSSMGVKINQNIRYGLQMAVHIGGTGTTNLSFQNPKASKEGAGTLFTIDVYNTGERMVKPKLSLELFDDTGKSAGKITSNVTRVYPGSAYRYRFTIPAEIAPKKYKALVIADCGDNKVFGANLNLSLEP